MMYGQCSRCPATPCTRAGLAWVDVGWSSAHRPEVLSGSMLLPELSSSSPRGDSLSDRGSPASCSGDRCGWYLKYLRGRTPQWTTPSFSLLGPSSQHLQQSPTPAEMRVDVVLECKGTKNDGGGQFPDSQKPRAEPQVTCSD